MYAYLYLWSQLHKVAVAFISREYCHTHMRVAHTLKIARLPELINSRQQRHGAIIQIPCMIHKLVLHLHLEVARENRLITTIHVERALKNGARAFKLLLTRFPLGVVHPHSKADFVETDRVLILLALLEAVPVAQSNALS